MMIRTSFALALSLTVACGGDSTGTTTTDGGASTGASDTGTDTGATPTTGTSELPTGGSGGGTEGASGSASEGGSTSTGDPSGSGTGGQGSGAACVSWYDALYESYRPACECEVQKGNFETVEACQAELAPPSDCACTIFAGAPETVALLECYQKAAEDKTMCLEGLNLCLPGDLLQGCLDDELAAQLKCGAPSDDICIDLQQMCGGEVPPVCGP